MPSNAVTPLVMTMIGISAMNTSTMEEKMAANDRNQKISFQNAEKTLVEAEQDILGKEWLGGLQSDFSNTNNPNEDERTVGYYTSDAPHFDYFSELDSWKTTSGKCIPASSGKSCYTVEDGGTRPPLTAQGYGQQPPFATHISKITVRGTDDGGIATAIIQSHLKKVLIQ